MSVTAAKERRALPDQGLGPLKAEASVIQRVHELQRLVEALRAEKTGATAQRSLREAHALLHSVEDSLRHALRAETQPPALPTRA